jgi:hypothetical protein
MSSVTLAGLSVWNIVAICTGVAESFSATVDLYQNTKVKGSPSLIIEDPRLG